MSRRRVSRRRVDGVEIMIAPRHLISTQVDLPLLERQGLGRARPPASAGAAAARAVRRRRGEHDADADVRARTRARRRRGVVARGPVGGGAAGRARLRARVHPAARHGARRRGKPRRVICATDTNPTSRFHTGADAVESDLPARTEWSNDSPHEHGPVHVSPGSVPVWKSKFTARSHAIDATRTRRTG